MNPNVRRLLAFLLIFSGLFLLHIFSQTAWYLALAAIMILFALIQIKRVGFKVRYLLVILMGIFTLFCESILMQFTRHNALIVEMIGFNTALFLGLYLFFYRRLKTEGKHLLAKTIIALCVAFALITDLMAAYAVLRGTI